MMAQPTLFPELSPLIYNGAPPCRQVDTSKAAAEKQKDRAPNIRAQILRFVRSQAEWGATAEDAGNYLARIRGLMPDTPCCRLSAAARLTELKLGGFIEDSGRRRKTQSGCAAIVWVATNKQGDGRVCIKEKRP
ncbi:MAG: hypothetical protein ACM359_18300 [Bacillota bacterium]